MKIPSNPVGYYNAENNYRQFDPKVKQDDPLQQQQGIKEVGEQDKLSKITSDEKISTAAIFSNQELATLKVLFGYESKEDFSLYGRNEVHNVQSGMLLDVKG